MKAFAFFLILIFIVVSCEKIDVENNQFIDDPNHPALKNKLKTKREILQGRNERVDFYYNSSGYLTKEEVYLGAVLEQTQIYERNQNGRNTKAYSYTSDSRPPEIQTFLLYEYENDMLVKSYSYSDGNLDWYIDHFYENDQLTESRKYKYDQLVSIERTVYDSSGRVFKALSFDEEEDILGSVRYEYKQDTVLMYPTNKNGIEKDAYYEEIYNSWGQIIEEAYLWALPLGRRVTNKYFYNEEYFLVESRHFDAGFPESMGPNAIDVYEYF